MVSAAPGSEELLRSEVRHSYKAEHVGLVNSFTLGFQLVVQYLKTRSLLAHTEGPILGCAHLVSTFSNFGRFGYPIPMFSYFFFSVIFGRQNK